VEPNRHILISNSSRLTQHHHSATAACDSSGLGTTRLASPIRGQSMSTTTPHRALPMATSYSPSQTTPRRVLGHLPPKAINTPSSQSASLESSQVARAQSPWKQPTTQASTALRDKENLASSYEHSKGKKRGIEEVDSAEVADHLKTLARRRGDSLMGPAVRLTTDAMHVHTVTYPSFPRRAAVS